ncbi:MAG: hypothetical protein JNG84_01770 [Archangium sp.]|nr:hypothetical protein [Archangium sp.]
MHRSLSLGVVVSSLCGCLTTISGVDGGDGCPSAITFGEPGEAFLLVATLCPRDGSVYVDSDSFVSLLDADGRALSFDLGNGCHHCPSPAVGENFPFRRETQAGEVLLTERRFDGRAYSMESTCPTNTAACALREPLPPQTITARVCVSRSLQNPTTLGALECQAFPVKVPFETSGVEARFR